MFQFMNQYCKLILVLLTQNIHKIQQGDSVYCCFPVVYFLL